MNKLVKTALLASALGVLSVNAYAENVVYGSGPWHGNLHTLQGNSWIGYGETIDEACKNTARASNHVRYPGYVFKYTYYDYVENKDNAVICWGVTTNPDGTTSGGGERIYFDSNFQQNL